MSSSTGCSAPRKPVLPRRPVSLKNPSDCLSLLLPDKGDANAGQEKLHSPISPIPGGLPGAAAC